MIFRQHVLRLVVGCVLVIGLSGLTAVGSSGETAQSEAHPGNFYAAPGVSDEFAVYLQPGLFVVQAPAGDYLLHYETHNGAFDIVFRATETSQLYIGLVGDDQVQYAIIYPGTVTDTSGETWASGNVTLYAWPGSSRTWQEVFAF
jgi:hypothetical protein